MPENFSETISVDVPGSTQTIVDILRDQYGNLDSGEIRAQLAPLEPEVWSTVEFSRLFDTINVHPPYVDVVRKQDGVAGTVMFIDSPRMYFSFNTRTARHDDGTA